jgi:hypothetical protein
MPIRNEITVTVSASGAIASSVVQLNIGEPNFNVSLAVSPGVGAAGLYDVQHTFGDVSDSNATLEWWNHPSLASASTSADGNIDFPATGVRLNVRAGASAAFKFYVVQSGY